MILQRRATIAFDPSNKAHRAAVHAFMRRRAWADSPFRFAYDPAYGSVAEQVQAKLLDWYVAQEETKVRAREARLGSKQLAFQLMGIASELPQEAIQ